MVDMVGARAIRRSVRARSSASKVVPIRAAYQPLHMEHNFLIGEV